MAIKKNNKPQKIKEEQNKFLIFCIEIYKNKKRLSGADAAHVFFEKHLDKYIIDNYSVLHTLGTEYLFEEFNEILTAR